MDIIGNINTEIKQGSEKIIRKRLRIKSRFLKTKKEKYLRELPILTSGEKKIHHSTDDSENEGILFKTIYIYVFIYKIKPKFENQPE